MYAIIEACGKQYKVEEKDVVFFEKLDVAEGKKISFDKILLVSDNGKVQVGTPYVSGFKVEGKVVSHGRGKKILVYKYKAKKNERKSIGHRQDYTKVEILSVGKGSEKAVAAKEETPKAAAKESKVAPKEEAKNESAPKKESTAKKPAVKKTTAKKEEE